jgi:hypothetical protein
MTTFVTKRYVHLNRSGSDQSTLDAAEAYITGTFRVGGDITLGDESTDLIHATGSLRISGTFNVGEVGFLPAEVGFFVSGARGARGQTTDPAVALFGGDLHVSGNLSVGGVSTVSSVDLPAEVGFFVSGAAGARGVTSEPEVALFGGDVHISGNLTVEGSSPGGSAGTSFPPSADFLTGFGEGTTAGDVGAWQMSSDPLASQTDWSVGVVLTRNTTSDGDGEQRIWSTSDQYLGGGATFALASDGAQPKLYFTDPGNTFRTVTSEYRTDYRAGTVFSVVTYTGGNVRMYVNGSYADGVEGSNTGQAYTPAGTPPPFTVGASGEPLTGQGTYGAEDWGIHAVCYVTRSLSGAEVLDWWRHVYVSGTLVDVPNAPGNGLNGAWRASTDNPSEERWTPFVGNTSLIKTGSKAYAVKSIPLRW